MGVVGLVSDERVLSELGNLDAFLPDITEGSVLRVLSGRERELFSDVGRWIGWLGVDTLPLKEGVCVGWMVFCSVLSGVSEGLVLLCFERGLS